jgi:tetratricopeptide (TPR) repeat protein
MTRRARSAALLVALSCSSPAAAEDPGDSAWAERTAAWDAYRAQDWTTAIDRFQRVTDGNPWAGSGWEGYGLSLLNAGRTSEAVRAFERCREIGYRDLVSSFNIVCAYSRAGRVDDALDALEQAYRDGYVDDHAIHTDPDLDPLRDHPRFAEIVGLPGEADLPRTQRWRRDLAFLDRRMREVHWDLFGVLPEAEYKRALGEIEASIDDRNDDELRWAIQRLLASIGDGHTSVALNRFAAAHGDERPFEIYPLETCWYGDADLRIQAIATVHAEGLGSRIESIGGRPTDQVLEQVLEHVSRDNELGARWMAMEVLADPTAMRAFGLARDDGALELEVRDGSRTGTITLFPAPNGSAPDLARIRGDEPPRWQRNRHRAYWFESLPDDALYVQFNRVRDDPQESIAEFSDRLLDSPEAAKAPYLVLDLRFNHGGSGHLVRPLLHRIIASPFNERGRLYVLIGRETFSAAMNFTSALEVHTRARFVGEPTGSRPNFVGETSLIHLPYSGLAVSCSSRWHQGTESNDRRLWIAPHVAAPLGIDDYRTGRDPALAAVRTIVAAAPAH